MNRFNPFVRPQIAMPTQAPLVRPEIAVTAQESVATLPRGYNGPGIYRVVAPSGLNLRSTPDIRNPSLYVVPVGWRVKVLGPASWHVPSGWVAVDSSNFYFTQDIRVGPGPAPANSGQPVRFMCMSCPEAPGGPWLVPDFSVVSATISGRSVG